MPQAKQDNIQFYIDQKKERNATVTDEDKIFQQATRKKQMRLQREHTVQTKIVAPSFVFVFHAETLSNEENSHISEGSCIESVSECEPETSGASTVTMLY